MGPQRQPNAAVYVSWEILRWRPLASGGTGAEVGVAPVQRVEPQILCVTDRSIGLGQRAGPIVGEDARLGVLVTRFYA